MEKIGSTQRIFVTGASGFVGRALIPALVAEGFEVHASSRSRDAVPHAARTIRADLLEGDLSGYLLGVDAIVHLAGRAHVMRESKSHSEAVYMRQNCELTRRLAESANRAGVRHLVFASSIKVVGEATQSHPFTEETPCAPADDYGRSKLAAERALSEIASDSGLNVTILRPPLMYGAGVKGNLLRLMRLLDKGVPLPIAGIRNKRSLLGVRNFASVIVSALRAHQPGCRAYLVSDGAPVSTPELVLAMAKALGRAPILFRVPNSMLMLAARLTGRTAELDRLASPLLIDDRRIRDDLRWSPPHPFHEGLREMAMYYRAAV